MIYKRYIISLLFGFLITFGMFFWMQYLISFGDIQLQTDEKRIHVDLGQVREVEDVRRNERQPEEITPEPTPETEFQMAIVVGNVSDPINLSADDVETANVNTGLGGTFIADGEYLPIVRVPPQYPPNAAEKGIEGYVIVEFTVTPNGSTTKVRVVESSHRMFERNAVRAAEKFKYKPKVVDGEPVYVDNVRTQLNFKLEA